MTELLCTVVGLVIGAVAARAHYRVQFVMLSMQVEALRAQFANLTTQQAALRSQADAINAMHKFVASPMPNEKIRPS